MPTSKRGTVTEFDLRLEKHRQRKEVVRLIRNFAGRDESIVGIVLLFNESFVLLQLAEKFQFNGYVVLPKCSIDSLRCRVDERVIRKVLKGEGILDAEYGLAATIDLKDWPSVFRTLRAADYHVIIEVEDREAPLFEIGPIERVRSRSISIRYYDPAGVLEDKPTSIPYEDITTLTFGDRYSTIFRNYLRMPTRR